MRKEHLWNNDWEFLKTDLGVSVEEISKSSEFAGVNIPHDWMIYDTNNLYGDSIGWYRKKFYVDSNHESMSLRFEGVYMDTTVYLNGKQVFEWKYGYSTFEFDITEEVSAGENEVIVKVVYQRDNTRWYSGAGIYRNVWLKEFPSQHLVSDGVYVHSEPYEDGYKVMISTEVSQTTGTNLGKLMYEAREVSEWKGAVRQTISFQKEGVCLETKELELQDFTTVHQEFILKNIKEWDIEAPNLYTLVTELLSAEGQVIDRVKQKIGFRRTEFDPDRGFLLNGRKVRLHGVCEHHDLGCLGAAVNKAAIRRKLNKLRKMGVNAIRTSHNMPAVEWMELCDEMGFLVDSEGFDMWEKSKTPFDYARFFKEWSRKDVASWIRRDRNHPSIIMWSIGNEIYDTHCDEHGQEITRYLCRYVAENDPYENALPTIGSNYMTWENGQKCADIVKLAGYNYTENLYKEHHEKHKDWVIYGSETSSTVQSRGVYKFPYAKTMLCDDDEQCSCLGNCTTSWGSKCTEYNIGMDRDAEFSMGQFIWTGFDYIGEPTPYSTKNSYFGQLDTAGFEKDTYYIYQAEWTSAKTAPMVHIFPYWDFNEGEEIDIRVCSNGAKVSLYFNKELVGSHEINHTKGQDQVAHFILPYKEGTLEAIAYDENGKEIASDVRTSFSDPVVLKVVPESDQILADGQDLLFVDISVLDQNGVEVANANNRVKVKVSGQGQLVGMDNGDSTDYDPYKCASRRLFNGKCLAVIKAGTCKGEVTVTVESEGMEPVSIRVPVLDAEVKNGISTLQEILSKEEYDKIYHLKKAKHYEENEIPIRSVKLWLDGNKTLTKENPTAVIHAQIKPANATYQDLIFKVTNQTGVDSNLAVLEQTDSDPFSRKITALGNGEIFVKCMVKNGSDKIKLISQKVLQIEGMGIASLNPYEFVYASLYTKSSTELNNGLDRGIAMAKNEVSSITFEKVDFGKIGSDKITIPIYELGNHPFPVEIWEGIPNTEGSECLGKFMYNKPSIWATYQEETFVLSKRIKGMNTLSIVAEHEINIKGFQFEQYEKAYETLQAPEYDLIYGDNYKVEKDAVTGIGNNVTLTFEQMNFTKGVKRIIICGRTPNETNTIHVRFQSESGSVNQIAEFKHSDEYVEQSFSLENVQGEQTLHFVFLPGCNFDFKYFRFEA